MANKCTLRCSRVGYDRAYLELKPGDTSLVWDELDDHIDTRYVSSAEACWRLFAKPIQAKSHTVVSLHVHEPGKNAGEPVPNENEANVDADDAAEADDMDAYDNTVPYELEDSHGDQDDVHAAQGSSSAPPPPADKARPRPPPSSSTLLAWFKLNECCPAARIYTYTEIVEHYRFVKNKNEFVKRKQFRRIVGRMYHVSPRDVELYHLRILLLYVQGATSYDDLKTFEGMLYRTFSEACVARGLTIDDQEHHNAMAEAASWVRAPRLRHFFAMILAHCEPKDPLSLWEKFQVLVSVQFWYVTLKFRTSFRRITRTGCSTSSER